MRARLDLLTRQALPAAAAGLALEQHGELPGRCRFSRALGSLEQICVMQTAFIQRRPQALYHFCTARSRSLRVSDDTTPLVDSPVP